MEKLMEPVSRLDVIKAFTLMDDPRDLKVIHIRNNKWSEDNSGQIGVITRSVAVRVLSRSKIDSVEICKIDSVEICKIDSREGIKVFPSGYYVCTFGEVLAGCEYSIKVTYQLRGITATAYLYYIGQDKY